MIKSEALWLFSLASRRELDLDALERLLHRGPLDRRLRGRGVRRDHRCGRPRDVQPVRAVPRRGRPPRRHRRRARPSTSRAWSPRRRAWRWRRRWRRSARRDRGRRAPVRRRVGPGLDGRGERRDRGPGRAAADRDGARRRRDVDARAPLPDGVAHLQEGQHADDEWLPSSPSRAGRGSAPSSSAPGGTRARAALGAGVATCGSTGQSGRAEEFAAARGVEAVTDLVAALEDGPRGVVQRHGRALAADAARPGSERREQAIEHVLDAAAVVRARGGPGAGGRRARVARRYARPRAAPRRRPARGRRRGRAPVQAATLAAH